MFEITATNVKAHTTPTQHGLIDTFENLKVSGIEAAAMDIHTTNSILELTGVRKDLHGTLERKSRR